MLVELRVVRSRHLTLHAGIVAALLLPSLTAAQVPALHEEGTTHVPAFVLPESSLLTSEARSALRKDREHHKEYAAKPRRCPPVEGADKAQMPEIL
jgi:hypothetical protein